MINPVIFTLVINVGLFVPSRSRFSGRRTQGLNSTRGNVLLSVKILTARRLLFIFEPTSETSGLEPRTATEGTARRE